MKREVRYFAQDGENIFYLCVHCKYFSADCAHIHCSTQTHTLIQTSFPTFPKTDYQWNLSQPSLRRSWILIGRSLAKMNELSRQSKYLFSLWGDLDLEISWPAPLPRSRCCWSQRRSAANRLIGEVVQSRRRPLLGPSPGWKRLLALSHLRHY